MDTIMLLVVFTTSVGFLYTVRRFKSDDRKLADAIIQVARRVKRLEKAVLPEHDIEPD